MGLLAAIALIATLLAAAVASAGVTQRVQLGQGTLPSPRVTWEASAVPQLPRGSILIDVLEGGTLRTTYGQMVGSLPGRGINAYGYRPFGLPSRGALVSGATGQRIRKVRVHFKGGSRRTVRTRPAPRDWGLRGVRLFATGASVPRSFARALRVVVKIQGLDGRGRVVATRNRVPTGAF